METPQTFDVVVIGSGPGGYACAERAGQLGLSVALVEKAQSLGGVCVNVGCIPSKALLCSAGLYAQARLSFPSHGIIAENISLDLGAMMKRKTDVVASSARGVDIVLKNARAKIFRGVAKLNSEGCVEVSAEGTGALLTAKHVVIASGSAPAVLSSVPFDHEFIIDSTDSLSLSQVPRSLLVIGGGAIGLEMACIWQWLGAQVTIVERQEQILPGMDAQVASLLTRSLRRQGIAIYTNSSAEVVERTGSLVRMRIEQSGAEPLTIECDKVLVAVGRRAFADNLGLDEAGVKRDPKSGSIVVDGQCRTSRCDVYAIGDVVRGPMLAHKAHEEAVAVAEILAGRAGRVNYEAIPAVVYSHPEVAAVGETEPQLAQRGTAFASGTFHFKANGRALASGDTEGFVKVLSEKQTDRVVGVHAIGAGVSEIIAEAVSVMEFGGSAEDIGRTVHAHPTLSEALRDAALHIQQ